MNAKVLFLAATLACTGLALADTHSTIAYWPFGESGLSDASGNGHALTGGATISDHATLGGSVGTLLQTASALDLSGYDTVTVEFFARIKDSTGVAMLMEHVSPTGSTTAKGAFYLDINERDIGEHRVAVAFQCVCATATPIACIDSTVGPLQDGIWHHVALVIKSKSTAPYDVAKLSDWCISLYVDGVIQKQEQRTALTKAIGGVALQNGILYIGSRLGSQNLLTGDMDDIRITEGALTPDEFLKKRTAASTAKVIARYPFGSEGLADATVNSNHLHASSGATLGEYGAVATDATLRYFQTRKPLDLRDYAEGLTVEFQFKAEATAPADARTLLYFAPTREGTTQRTLAVLLDNGAVRSVAKGGLNETNGDRVTGTVSFADGQWHHVAWVYNPYDADDSARLYVDGTNVGVADGGSAALNGLGKGFLALGIGHVSYATAGFDGELDDVRITGAALDPADFTLTRTVEAGAARVLPDPEPFTLAHWKFCRHAEFDDEAGLYPLVETRTKQMAFREGAAVFNGQGGLRTLWALDLTPYDRLTVEFYYQYPRWRVSDTAISMSFLELSDNFNNNAGSFRISTDAGYNANPGLLGALLRTSKGYSGDLYTSPVPGDSQWHRAAYLIDVSGEKTVTELYIDGVKVPHDANAFNKTDLVALSSSYRLFFGGRWNAQLKSGETWKTIGGLIGKMDDVRISVGLLPASEQLAARSAEALPVPVPYARWTFEGDDPRADSSGNGHRLHVSGPVSFTGGAAELNGSSSLFCPSLFKTGCRAFTIETLVRNDRPYDADNMLFQLGYDFSAFGSSQFFCLLSATGNAKAGYAGCAREFALRNVNAGEWTHVALVSDFDATRTCDRVAFYVNGEKASESSDYNVPDGLRVDQDLMLGTKNLKDLNVTGAFADVAVSEGALDPETFALRRPLPYAGPVILYWPFTKSHPERDKSGNGYGLEANDSVSFDTDGFARIADGGVVKSLLCLPLNTCTNGMTVECWLRLDAAVQTGYLVRSTHFGVNETAGATCLDFLGGTLYSRWINGFVKDFAGNVSRLDSLHSCSGASLADGQWHHVALVVDPDGEMERRSRLYVDFAEMPVVSGRDVDRPQAILNGFLCVGGNGFAGCIDDVRVTAAALGPSQFLQQRTPRRGMAILVR